MLTQLRHFYRRAMMICDHAQAREAAFGGFSLKNEAHILPQLPY